jgi:hypothetical protein
MVPGCHQFKIKDMSWIMEEVCMYLKRYREYPSRYDHQDRLHPFLYATPPGLIWHISDGPVQCPYNQGKTRLMDTRKRGGMRENMFGKNVSLR